MASSGSGWKDYQINARVPQGSTFGPTLLGPLLYINVLPDHVICNIAIYADDAAL